MSTWSAGYVADIGYTYGYYSELNPLRVKLAFLNAGLVYPEFGNACELGFGQGLSTNLHAAATLISWHGTDFNPSQAGFAQELARAAGTDAQLFDDTFADFAQRIDLPEFDYIGLHGIWSWISDENRAVIVDFLRRKLKVGGVLYISYNTMPGWASFAPLRDLMTDHSEIMGSHGHGIVSRINDAVDFADKLLATNPLYARVNPQVVERIQKLKDQNRHYLAHEYFNRDWHPMPFSKMAQWLEPAKLGFACSAHYLDHIEGINLTSDQTAFLNQIPDPMFRESVRDFMVNQQFRRDYWVKGARKLSTLEQVEDFYKQGVVLTSHRPDISLKLNGALGEASMSAEIYNPLLDLLADHQSKTVAQIVDALKEKNINFNQLSQAVIVLVGAGHLALVQDKTIVSKARVHTEKANAYLIERARSSDEIGYLASPVTGGGYAVNRFQQLFLRARAQGKKKPAEWAQDVWDVLWPQRQRLVKDGKTLESAEENLAHLTAGAEEFLIKQIPILKALQIV
ncbi:MAG: class I SAM-dependent methyltransferase [Pseudomonadota bacterium]